MSDILLNTTKDEAHSMAPIPDPGAETISKFWEHIGIIVAGVVAAIVGLVKTLQYLVMRRPEEADERITTGTRANRVHDPRPECLMEFQALKQTCSSLVEGRTEIKNALVNLESGRRQNGEKMAGLDGKMAGLDGRMLGLDSKMDGIMRAVERIELRLDARINSGQ